MRTIGLNPVAGQAIEEYISHAGLTSGPLFRPRHAPSSEKLAARAMGELTLYRLILGYLVVNGWRSLDFNFFTKLPLSPGETGGGVALAVAAPAACAPAAAEGAAGRGEVPAAADVGEGVRSAAD